MQPSSSRQQPLEEKKRVRRNWKQVWQSQLPPKICTFVWRACHEALPTLEQLARRNRDVLNECPICGVSEESLQHILLRCPFARQVWVLSNLPWGIIATKMDSVLDWLWVVYEKLDRGSKDKFLALCWGLWQNRDQVFMEGKTATSLVVVRNTSWLYEEYVTSGRMLRPTAIRSG
ncbi:hypothetical protein Salat_1596000 [Sesamum alatum]|uniref:Reverse transcriptase zinc-binding domain-containing protein n=1 Tax=Sesamum alatum TaxID=300844 RepID=A0AAE2CJ34_9LAMI|nr:hypothetical protein Salat_1596000 [Sesamum alatum]